MALAFKNGSYVTNLTLNSYQLNYCISNTNKRHFKAILLICLLLELLYQIVVIPYNDRSNNTIKCRVNCAGKRK